MDEQWEYAALVMQVAQEGTQMVEYVVWREASGATEPLEPEQWLPRMAAAGRDGWELVSTSSGASHQDAYFKRRIPNAVQ